MLQRIRPTSAGQRHHVRAILETVGGAQNVPLNLRKGKRRTGGRCHTGRITTYHRGGGTKRIHRRRANGGRLYGIGTVSGIQYDPNRSAHLARRTTEEHGKVYILAAHGLKVGERVQYGDSVYEKDQKGKREERESLKVSERPKNVQTNGSTMRLKSMLDGWMVFNLERIPGRGGQYLRSAGMYGTIMRKDRVGNKVWVRRKRGRVLERNGDCTATVGQASGQDHHRAVLGKAGRRRAQGWRPTVRGEAMNPVDHPHGGRTRGGRPEVTPWGQRAKGRKTRSASRRWVVQSVIS